MHHQQSIFSGNIINNLKLGDFFSALPSYFLQFYMSSSTLAAVSCPIMLFSLVSLIELWCHTALRHITSDILQNGGICLIVEPVRKRSSQISLKNTKWSNFWGRKTFFLTCGIMDKICISEPYGSLKVCVFGGMSSACPPLSGCNSLPLIFVSFCTLSLFCRGDDPIFRAQSIKFHLSYRSMKRSQSFQLLKDTSSLTGNCNFCSITSGQMDKWDALLLTHSSIRTCEDLLICPFRGLVQLWPLQLPALMQFSHRGFMHVCVHWHYI